MVASGTPKTEITKIGAAIDNAIEIVKETATLRAKNSQGTAAITPTPIIEIVKDHLAQETKTMIEKSHMVILTNQELPMIEPNVLNAVTKRNIGVSALKVATRRRDRIILVKRIESVTVIETEIEIEAQTETKKIGKKPKSDARLKLPHLEEIATKIFHWIKIEESGIIIGAIGNAIEIVIVTAIGTEEEEVDPERKEEGKMTNSRIAIERVEATKTIGKTAVQAEGLLKLRPDAIEIKIRETRPIGSQGVVGLNEEKLAKVSMLVRGILR